MNGNIPLGKNCMFTIYEIREDCCKQCYQNRTRDQTGQVTGSLVQPVDLVIQFRLKETFEIVIFFGVDV